MQVLVALAALLLAVPARAQAQPEAPLSRTDAAAVRLLAGAVGLAAGRVAAVAVDGEELGRVFAFQAGYTVGVGLTLPLIADAFGPKGDVLRAVGGAALGGAIGSATTAGLWVLLDPTGDDRTLGESIMAGGGVIVIGTLVTVGLAPRLALEGYTVRPAVLAAPTGEPGAGLSLRVGL